MKTITQTFSGYFESKGSKFFCFVLSFDDFASKMAELKAAHPKAVHFVSASRFLNEFSQIVESFDDDGEPKGSSAPPLLNILRGHELINVAVIVVRYFGGTLLGVGGLVKAYGNALKNALDSNAALIIPYEKLESATLQIPYSALSLYEYKAKNAGVNLEKTSFDLESVSIKITGTKLALAAVLDSKN